LYAALAVGTLRGVHKTGTPPSSVLSLLHPFHEVGGDFLDFFPLTDGAIGISKSDNNEASAIVTMIFKGRFRHRRGSGSDASAAKRILPPPQTRSVVS